MLADLIREFCNEPENNYEVYENYSVTVEFGEKITTLGIIVPQDASWVDILVQLTSYLEAKGFDDKLLELDGADMAEFGSDAIVFFPAIQDYKPLQA